MRDGAKANFAAFEFGDLAQRRLYKYSRGTVYYDTHADELIAQYCLPPALRAGYLSNLHPSQLSVALETPFDLERLIRQLVKIECLHPGRAMGLSGLQEPQLFGDAAHAYRRARVESA
jgi:hypothetical protein